ncbi:MAG: hypothetical protein JW801_10130 [Bacteroidales bacterium]|nr:hypothetical protein [Bacteroidales bacterium]
MKLRKIQICLFVFLFIAQISFGQKDYSAMILSIDGEGVVIRNSSEQPLQVPQRFIPGDEVSVKSGNALIMLFSGEEVPLSAVSYYTIPKEKSPSHSAVAKLANNTDDNILAQSGSAYRIRGFGSTFKVFPRNSKLMDIENAVLRVDYAKSGQLDLGLSIRDANTQKVIFTKENVSDTSISLSEVPFEAGHSYYWTITNTPVGGPSLGTIIIPEEESKVLPELTGTPKSNFDYLEAISAFYSEKYYFEALNLILEAKAKYPGVEIYDLMLGNILAE